MQTGRTRARRPARGLHQGVVMRIAIASSLLVGASLLPCVAGANGPANCAVSFLRSRAPAGTMIVSAVVAPAQEAPEHCLVEGAVTTPDNSVNFQLGLPTRWNGKFLFQGVG